jgi:hypothetical protein
MTLKGRAGGTDKEPIMSPDRTQAYMRVMRTLDELGPTKLHGLEQDVIRDAADSLIFAASASEAEAGTAIANIEALVEHLSGSGRWLPERAAGLLEDILACGPHAPAPVA